MSRPFRRVRRRHRLRPGARAEHGARRLEEERARDVGGEAQHAGAPRAPIGNSGSVGGGYYFWMQVSPRATLARRPARGRSGMRSATRAR